MSGGRSTALTAEEAKWLLTPMAIRFSLGPPGLTAKLREIITNTQTIREFVEGVPWVASLGLEPSTPTQPPTSDGEGE